MSGLNLKLLVPYGKPTISAFYALSKTLEGIIEIQMGHVNVKIVPLPHPSGISLVHQIQEHRALIYQAFELIRSTHLM